MSRADGQAISISSLGKTEFRWNIDNYANVYDGTVQIGQVTGIIPSCSTTSIKAKRDRGGVNVSPLEIRVFDATNHIQLTQSLVPKTMTVDQGNDVHNTLFGASYNTFVIDPNTTLETSVVGHGYFETDKTISKDVCVEVCNVQGIESVEGIKVCYSQEDMENQLEFSNTFKSANVRVSSLPDYRYLHNEAVTYVVNGVPMDGYGGTSIAPITMTVENYRPPTFGNTGSGSTMKDIRIVAQKQSFVEIVLNFENAVVLNVQGLPDGMVFDKDLKMLKGSPTISGKYPITIELDNGFNLEGLIIVPELPRRF